MKLKLPEKIFRYSRENHYKKDTKLLKRKHKNHSNVHLEKGQPRTAKRILEKSRVNKGESGLLDMNTYYKGVRMESY